MAYGATRQRVLEGPRFFSIIDRVCDLLTSLLDISTIYSNKFPRVYVLSFLLLEHAIDHGQWLLRLSKAVADLISTAKFLAFPSCQHSMASPPRRTIFEVSPVVGQKRPAPSLLPAFEPLSSSPRLPRLSSRITHASPSKSQPLRATPNYLPSAPTSSTFIPTSPPANPIGTRRPGLQRTFSALSERTPLATVPSIELDEHGEPTLMGRSSNSSHYQLSTNKLISRVHLRAIYIAATETAPKKVQIKCIGCNGVKVHCQGKAWDLFKGDTFTSQTEDAEIMIDVQDARVLIVWPRHEQKILTPTDSEGTWDNESSPSRRLVVGESARSEILYTSPLRQLHRPQSPVSPSPITQPSPAAAAGHMISRTLVPIPVQIYEDGPSDGENDNVATQPTQSTQVASQKTHTDLKSSVRSDPDSFSDHDEENDPIIHSFGPYGANLNSRMETFTTSLSPELRRPLGPLKEGSISPQRLLKAGSSPKRLKLTRSFEDATSATRTTTLTPLSPQEKDIVNFTINHLMYSQLSATPLSVLVQHVTAHIAAARESDDHDKTKHTTCDISAASLQLLLQSALCIGAVQREGKDAAGKQLESEYYYMPEQDEDEGRRGVVKNLGIGGRGLRNCRKSHKVGGAFLP